MVGLGGAGGGGVVGAFGVGGCAGRGGGTICVTWRGVLLAGITGGGIGVLYSL